VAISPSASDSSEDEPRWLTATEAADLLGVSYNTIVNWENAGRLHAHKQRRLLTNGQHREIRVFKEAEVRKFLRRRHPNEEDEVAARAFEMFEEGRSIREIVIALRVRPERIERLHDQWEDFGGAELVITPAECLDCGFAFSRREKPARPSRCARCHGSRLTLPEFAVRER